MPVRQFAPNGAPLPLSQREMMSRTTFLKGLQEVHPRLASQADKVATVRTMVEKALADSGHLDSTQLSALLRRARAIAAGTVL